MRITNNLGLPEAFYQAVVNDNYTKGYADYSVSDLVNPPQLTLLKLRHHAEIVEDVSDRIWSLMGKAVHHILEQGIEPHTLKEMRVYTVIAGRVISGQFDHLNYEKGKLSDYKLTSSWSIVYGSAVEEWTQRLNCYAYLLGSTKMPVKELEIVAVFRDWNPNEAEKYPDYPESEVRIIPINLWTLEAQEEFVRRRVELLKSNEFLSDERLTPCTPDETWETSTKYAVMKHGRKTAVRVFGAQDEADEMIARQGNGHFIEIRPGARTRCEGKFIRGREKRYCPVRDFCHQFKRYHKTNTKEESHEGNGNQI